MAAQFDTLIKGATIFDGSGGDPFVGDVAVRGGHIVDIAQAIEGDALDTIDAKGLWLTPGLLDIHTHLDLEVELNPGLHEAVRHGTTTVVVANCSLGMAFGSQREGDADPIVDCFARVENVPKHILRKVADKANWSTSKDYLNHLDDLKLGANVVAMIPYSMLRIEAMGVDASVSRNPTQAELSKMESLLEAGMREGYAGFSSDALPFHYLSNDPNREKRIPSQYAGFSEIKRLVNVVRKYGRVWQATPPTEEPLKVLRYFLLTSGRLYKKALKLTAVAALDVRSNRNIIRSAFTLAWLLNSPIFKGDFHLQSLAAPFKVWGDGPITPLSEEIPELRELAMLDLEDDKARRAIYNDPGFEARFKAMWREGKVGWGLKRLKRLVRLEDNALRRDPDEMFVERAPVDVWKGESFTTILDRLKQYQATGEGARTPIEKAAFDRFPPCKDDADFVFHLFKTYDRDIYWWTISANADEKMLRRLTMSALFLPGFSDSGAHLTNLAFYDVNLRALKIAEEERGLAGVAYMVRRLTREPAAFFGVDAGRLESGAQADIALIDPTALSGHDGVANTKRIYREQLGHDQLVNRAPGVVAMTMVAGKAVWRNEKFGVTLGTVKLGRVLRSGGEEPSTMALAAE
ncbi:MAG: N-acyl-D-glutamate deacylase [Pseudomonadota bacterium]